MNDTKDRIVEQLDTLTKLVACALLEGKPRRQQIELLSRAGLPPRQIAELLGTTPNAVSVDLVSIRKAKKHRGKLTKKGQR